MSRATDIKKFEIHVWRKDWGHHKDIVEAASADEAIDIYKAKVTKFPIEWIAEVRAL